MRFRWIAACTVMLAVVVMACERHPSAPTGSGPPVRGITFVDWTADGFGLQRAVDSLNELAATGANTVVILVTAYQEEPGGTTIRTTALTPEPRFVADRMTQATSLGLASVIKPHIDLTDGAWRGEIAPRDPDAWFASYRAFLLPWARLADSLAATQFVVGTELAGTLGHEARWRETIAEVRAVFTGELVYAASWDEAHLVPFWDALDLVGVDFYFPVAGRDDPGRLEILAGWQPWLDRLKRLRHRAGRDVLLTEVGYRSVDGAGQHPYEFQQHETVDMQEQADLYWAALEAVSDESWLRGLYWWNWPTAKTESYLTRDYTPRGKPAEAELQSAWGSGS